MFRSEDDVPTGPKPNAFRPSVETLETRFSPAVISAPDVYTVRSGRVLTTRNLPPLPTNLSVPQPGRGVLGNDYDDTITPAPQYLRGLTATLISGPVEVATGIPVTTPFQFNNNGPGSFSFRAPRNFNGAVQFTYQASNAAGTTGAVTTATINVTGPIRRVAVGAGEGGSPRVDVFDSSGKNQLFSFYAYDQGMTSGVRVATGDFNGDGVDDIVTVPGPGAAPNVRIFSGRDGSLLQSFYALDPSFTGGANIATGDVNGDGQDDIILGADRGGDAHVVVLDGATFTTIASFYAYDPGFTGGVRVAAGDFTGSATSTGQVGTNSILTAPGFGGAPNVRQYDINPTDGSLALSRSFYAGDPTDTRGLYITAGDYNGDYTDDIAVGSGAGVAEVRVYNGIDLSLYYSKNFGDPQQLPVDDGSLTPTQRAAQSRLTFGLTNGPGPDPASLVDTATPPPAGTLQGFYGGVRVSTSYANRDDNADLVLGTGPNAIPEMTILGGGGGAGGLFATTITDRILFGGKFYGGVFVTGHQ